MSLCRQRAGCLIAEHLSAAEKHGPSPALSSSINSFLLFPRPARISSLPCLAMTSKLLFGYDRLSGNRPFPPLCLNRCSYSSAEEGGVGGGESELKAGIITSAAERACPLLVWTQKHHRIMLAHSSERFSFGTIEFTFL